MVDMEQSWYKKGNAESIISDRKWMYVLFSFEFWSNKVEWKANESVWGKNVMAWNNFMAHDFFLPARF